MDKHWIVSALEYLAQSLEPVPHEINEIDWKTGLSPEKNRLTEHLIAAIHLPKTTRTQDYGCSSTVSGKQYQFHSWFVSPFGWRKDGELGI